MDKVIQERFNQVDRDRTEIKDDLKAINGTLFELGKTIGEISGAVKPKETHWAIKSIVAPLVVLLIGWLVTSAYRNLDERIRNIELFVNDNGGFIAGLHLQQNASDPSSPQRIAEVQRVLSTARQKNIRIPPDLVANAGRKFVQVSQTAPDAWKAVADFLNYQSFLNIDLVPTGNLRAPETSGSSYYSKKNLRGSRPPQVNWMGYSHFPDVAQFRGINDPDLNAEKPGPAFLVIDGADVLLDDMHIKRVIFKNSRVVYQGGPVSLDTVYFVNCTFDIVREPNGLRLADQVLSSSATTAQIGM